MRRVISVTLGGTFVVYGLSLLSHVYTPPGVISYLQAARGLPLTGAEPKPRLGLIALGGAFVYGVLPHFPCVHAAGGYLLLASPRTSEVGF